MLSLLKKFFTRRLAMRLMVGFTIGVMILGAAGALNTRVAYAQDAAAGDTTEDDCSGFGFCSILEAIGDAIATLINAVSALIGQLIQLLADGIIELIAYSAKVVEMPAVQAGFQVSLGVVNLIFVMALIIISFQIILGIHEGEAKKQLVNVIIAAILVNFSLLIAGLLLDISNVFTVFFMHPVTSENIRGALNPSQFRAMNELSSGGGFFAAVMPALFSLFMSAIILIILIAVFATVLMRLLRVACLLLVMPLTWGFWVFPGLDKYYKDWWHEFIKWGVVMLPTMTFFMYLGIMTVNQMANWTGAKPADQTIQGTLGGLLQMLIIGGIMVAGIKIGQEAGGVSASAAIGAAKTAAGYAAKPIMGARLRVGGRDYGIKPGMQKVAGWGSSVMNKVGNVPVLGTITGARAAASGLAGMAHGDEHEAQEFQKNRLKDLSDHDLNNFKGKNRVEDAAHLKELAARGKVGDYVNEDNGIHRVERIASLQRMTAAAGINNHKSGNDLTDIKEVKDAIEAMPTLAPSILGRDPNSVPPGQFYRTVTQQLARMSPSKIAELHHSTFDPKTPEGQEALAAVGNNPAAMKAIYTTGAARLQDAVTKGQRTMLNTAIKNPADRTTVIDANIRLTELDKEMTEARDRNDGKEVKKLQVERKTLISKVDGIAKAAPTTEAQTQVRAFINGENARLQVVNRNSGNLLQP